MELGAFQVSLPVKDIGRSKTFHSKSGFEVFEGDESENRLVVKNGVHTAGLFQSMFERNVLTFSPGWNQNAEKIASSTDVREIRKALKAEGISLETEADVESSGPASLILMDPDGNTILIDRHV